MCGVVLRLFTCISVGEIRPRFCTDRIGDFLGLSRDSLGREEIILEFGGGLKINNTNIHFISQFNL